MLQRENAMKNFVEWNNILEWKNAMQFCESKTENIESANTEHSSFTFVNALSARLRRLLPNEGKQMRLKIQFGL